MKTSGPEGEHTVLFISVIRNSKHLAKVTRATLHNQETAVIPKSSETNDNPFQD